MYLKEPVHDWIEKVFTSKQYFAKYYTDMERKIWNSRKMRKWIGDPWIYVKIKKEKKAN